MIFNFDKEIISGLPFRWYSTMFMIGFLYGSWLLNRFYIKDGNENHKEISDKFFIYAIISVLLGARLGHVVFYQWDYYSNHLIEIIQIWEGGLASHGGAIGLFLSIVLFYILYKEKYKITLFGLLDKIMITALIMASLIRIGNFANSEILGNETESKFGIVFVEDFKDYLKKNGATNLKFKENTHFVEINFDSKKEMFIPNNYIFDGLKNFRLKKIINQNNVLSYDLEAELIKRYPAQLFESVY